MLRIAGKELSYEWNSEPLKVQFGVTRSAPLNRFEFCVITSLFQHGNSISGSPDIRRSNEKGRLA